MTALVQRLLIVVCLTALVVAGIFCLNLWVFAETPYNTRPVTLRIEPGTSLREVTRQLEREGVVSNALFFQALVTVRKSATRVRAGEYDFPPALRPTEVLTLLQKGDFPVERVTIPEGWTVVEIAGFLQGRGLVDRELFLEKAQKLEGYLFPDTYEFYRGSSEQEITQKMVRRFQDVVEPVYRSASVGQRLTLSDVVTLASVVEKETGEAKERPMIASVFLNRLKAGMALASDPTVIYGIANFSGNLTREDLDRPGEYNTYLNSGLPPTPIANPGLDSIRAVLEPAETDFLYFVSRGDGTHQFSRTSAEHARAVAQYQLGGSRLAGSPSRPERGPPSDPPGSPPGPQVPETPVSPPPETTPVP